MRVVYALFGSPSGADVRACASSGQEDPKDQAQQPKSRNDSCRKVRKRGMKDRDSPPPEDDGDRRGNRDKKTPKIEADSLPLACPFHKYNPGKYCANSDTGKLYRSCAGPGFSSVSRLR